MTKSRVGGWFSALRIACAVALIAVSLWALLLPPLFPFSSHAIVNTKIVTLRARDEGRIGHLAEVKSAALKAGDRVASVTRDLSGIQRTLQKQEFARQKLKEQLDSLDRTIAGQEEALARARAGDRRMLEQSYKDAREKVRIYGENLAEKKAAQARVAPLFADGIITSAQWSDVRGRTIEAEKNLMAAQSDLTRIQASRDGAGGPSQDEAAAAGRDGQSLSSLRLRRIELKADLDEAEHQIAAEKTYRDSDRSYDITTPIDGVVWRSQVVNGENVAEGDPVADVADAHAIFVEAYFRRDFMNSISVGDEASVYLIGESRFVTGRVTDIQVQERTASAPDIIDTVPLDSAMLRVSLAVSSGAGLTTDNVGQLAKVLVSGSRPGWARRGLVWLSLYLRSHK